ncbi:ABC transporter substrate-binding protein [Mesorhizobium sp. CO1-1-8]|uniref:ABC transporter substrate-binding protein n=1 Tax=Mesorhizobium sp. CO1-1-8 TaxID=2876631 RepID=UPI001CD0B5E9|nr:ABC transporter substrate-binding protein [Mesorhizobium sp. CO1-1-8]MBZ9772253.1 ABC transporter substrate-binding protein [Mesorhizobium sp. CO1-1-8]
MASAKIGLLIGKTGPLAIWAPSCVNAAIIGAAEANVAGGVLGAEIDLVVRDAGWDASTTVDAALDMVEVDGASVIVGLIGSNSRDQVSAAIGNKVPFVYTPTYERNSRRSNVISLSATDDVLMRPLLGWIEERFQARRFFLIGSDYRWPRETMPRYARMISEWGNSVLGIRARPIDAPDAWDNQMAEELKRLKPDILLVFLVGDQSIPFYRAFSHAGLAAKIPRFAIATDETILLGLGADQTEGLFAGAHYFASLSSDSNSRFKEHYWNAFGDTAAVPNTYGQSFYEGVSYSVALMRAAGSTQGKATLATPASSIEFRSARFETSLTNLTRLPPVYVAEANGLSFDIVARY